MSWCWTGGRELVEDSKCVREGEGGLNLCTSGLLRTDGLWSHIEAWAGKDITHDRLTLEVLLDFTMAPQREVSICLCKGNSSKLKLCMKCCTQHA